MALPGLINIIIGSALLAGWTILVWRLTRFERDDGGFGTRLPVGPRQLELYPMLAVAGGIGLTVVLLLAVTRAFSGRSEPKRDAALFAAGIVCATILAVGGSGLWEIIGAV